MANNIEALSETQYFITDEQAAEYDHAFTGAYWWNAPDQLAPLPATTHAIASKQGKRFISSILNFNDGMLNIGDPVEKVTAGLDVFALPTGSMVKVIHERLIRNRGFTADPSTYVHAVEQDGPNFAVYRYSGNEVASYSMRVDWYLAVPNRLGATSLFDLGVDHARSYGSGTDRHLMASIQLQDAQTRNGVEDLQLGVTITPEEGPLVIHTRNSLAVVYAPKDTTRRAVAPIDLSSFS